MPPLVKQESYHLGWFLSKFTSVRYAQKWYDFSITRYSRVILVTFPATKRNIKAYLLVDYSSEIKKVNHG